MSRILDRWGRFGTCCGQETWKPGSHSLIIKIIKNREIVMEQNLDPMQLGCLRVPDRFKRRHTLSLTVSQAVCTRTSFVDYIKRVLVTSWYMTIHILAHIPRTYCSILLLVRIIPHLVCVQKKLLYHAVTTDSDEEQIVISLSTLVKSVAKLSSSTTTAGRGVHGSKVCQIFSVVARSIKKERRPVQRQGSNGQEWLR